MKTFIYIGIFLIAAFVVCASPKGDELQFISFEELLAHRDVYDGKEICLMGYYREKEQLTELYGKDPGSKNMHGDILWVGGRQEGIPAAIVKRPTMSYVLIVGRYENKPLGTFDRYFGAINDVKFMYPVAKPKS